ncbi:hypothetical protein GCM10025867_02420 [Frondihabitans sucicola]|uniref:NIPSNAP family containing protein n=1 Tax=Frondihabitans sucicola TaxID=1268041 RepID=A0ABM8GI05_9MICO|nr:hypothetical protein [Frondihabitans sucicola]BDZ48001.1 hypothetical protein GCM10025867_02420 [Frondihabitans sucicola]
MTTPDRTVQLRRYVLEAGVLDEFLAWWHELLVPARRAFDFTVEFGYALPETNEFVWAVSLPGDRDHFLAVEADYIASPERAAAFGDRASWTTSQVISFAEPAI